MLRSRELAGLEPYVVGEMIVAGAIGSFLILLVVLAHRGVAVSLRRFELRFVASLVAFGVFGVVLDGIHSLVDHRLGRGLLGLVEDAGELFTMTFVAVTSIDLAGFARTRGAGPLRRTESEDSPSSTHETLGSSKTQA
jgi:hypothetical protein